MFKLRLYYKPIIVAIMTALLFGCASSTPPSSEITFSADNNINPNIMGQASPVLVNVYQLDDKKQFDNVDQPENMNSTILNDSLVNVDSFMLTPGEKQQYTIPLDKDTKYLGIVGEFRTTDNDSWKILLDDPQEGNDIHINKNSLSVDNK